MLKPSNIDMIMIKDKHHEPQVRSVHFWPSNLTIWQGEVSHNVEHLSQQNDYILFLRFNT